MKASYLIAAVITTLAVNSARAQAWQYEQQQDKMTGKVAKFATLTSKNSLSLPFPYRGKNYGQLTIRQHPKHGLDVIVSAEKGQVLCRSYDGCVVSVRFDAAAPSRFSANAPADHSTEYVFIENVQRFIAAAKKSKQILVQLPFYQAGEQVLEFTTSDVLVWPPK